MAGSNHEVRLTPHPPPTGQFRLDHEMYNDKEKEKKPFYVTHTSCYTLDSVDGSMSMSELFNDTHAIKTACIQCTVNIFGVLAMVILYYNYILLQPYFSALLWATLVSIPLHKLKRALLRLITKGTRQKKRPGMLTILASLIHMALKFLFGRSWKWLTLVPKYYLSQVNRFHYDQEKSSSDILCETESTTCDVKQLVKSTGTNNDANTNKDKSKDKKRSKDKSKRETLVMVQASVNGSD